VFGESLCSHIFAFTELAWIVTHLCEIVEFSKDAELQIAFDGRRGLQVRQYPLLV
jgi:hypothetical protein